MIAQTNLQLAAQLGQANWPSSDLARVANAYAAALDLFAGAVRSSGKPFLCHLVGTASATAHCGGSPTLTAAALVHAAYDQGDFGTPRLGRTRTHVRRLRRAVGAAVESYVADFHEFDVSEASVEDLEQRAERLDQRERDLVLLLLANEVDDHHDGGLAAIGTAQPWRNQASTVARLVDLGRRSGLVEIADLLERSASSDAGAIAPEFRRIGPKRSSWAKPRVRSLHRLPATVAGISALPRHAAAGARPEVITGDP